MGQIKKHNYTKISIMAIAITIGLFFKFPSPTLLMKRKNCHFCTPDKISKSLIKNIDKLEVANTESL